MRKRIKFSSPAWEGYGSREQCPAAWLCIKKVTIVWWLAVEMITRTKLRAQVFTAQPKVWTSDLSKEHQSYWTWRDTLSAEMMEMVVVCRVDRCLMIQGASSMLFNCTWGCVLSTLMLGAGKSLELSHDRNFHARVCSFLFTSALVHLRSATITISRHPFYTINFQIFCKMSFLLHLRLALTTQFVVSFTIHCGVLFGTVFIM